MCAVNRRMIRIVLSLGFHWLSFSATPTSNLRFKTMDFASKVYIVTGGAAGIGLAIVKALLDHGAIVYTCDIHDKISTNLAALPQQQQLTYARCDVRERSDCQSFVRTLVDKHKRIDGLVNNAGICPLEGELPGDDLYDAAFDVNVRGVWNFGTETLAQMKKTGGGSVINIGSISCLQGVRRLPLYVATKHAVLGLTRTWALDFAQYKIRVNCVAPGQLTAVLSSCLTDS
jgi:NAD(P)-dependent dehydrogenase (short-subunit alcohol dehydrogenase family)